MDLQPTFFAPKDAPELPKSRKADNVAVLSVRDGYSHNYAEPFVRIIVDGKHFDIARSKEGEFWNVFAKAFESLYR